MPFALVVVLTVIITVVSIELENKKLLNNKVTISNAPDQQRQQ